MAFGKTFCEPLSRPLNVFLRYKTVLYNKVRLHSPQGTWNMKYEMNGMVKLYGFCSMFGVQCSVLFSRPTGRNILNDNAYLK